MTHPRPPIRVTLDGDRPEVRLTVDIADAVVLSADDRIIEGTITVYGKPSRTQGVFLHPGSLKPLQPLDRVKLCLDHDTKKSVGYMLSVDPATEKARFQVSTGTLGDEALRGVKDKDRDAFSVGFLSHEFGFDDNMNFHVYDGEMYEVSLCAVADFTEASVKSGVAAALAANTSGKGFILNREQLAAALANGTITQDTYNRQIVVLDASDAAAREEQQRQAPAQQQQAPAQQQQQAPAQQQQAPAQQIQAELSQGPERQAHTPAGQTTPRQVSLQMVSNQLAMAIRQDGGRVGQAVMLALADILPAQDAGEAFLKRPDWLGELFRAREIGRPWIDSFGVPGPLTTWKARGWYFTKRPKVGKYAGNKTEVPTGDIATAPKEFTAERWAGGWDIDRMMVDFQDGDFLRSFWDAAMDSYKEESDVDVSDKVLDIALSTGHTDTATTVLGGINRLAARSRGIRGASFNRFFLSDDLFEDYANLTRDEVPHWLASATGTVDLLGGSGNVGNQLQIASMPEVPARTIVGYDSRAARVKERAPIEVQAVNVAQGGIDLGLYSYGMFEVHDERLFRSVTIPA